MYQFLIVTLDDDRGILQVYIAVCCLRLALEYEVAKAREILASCHDA